MKKIRSFQDFEAEVKAERIIEPDFDNMKSGILSKVKKTTKTPKRSTVKICLVAAAILIFSIPVYSAASLIFAEIRNSKGETILSIEEKSASLKYEIMEREKIEARYRDLIDELERDSLPDEVTYLVVPMTKNDPKKYFVKIINIEPVFMKDFDSFIKTLYGEQKFPMIIPSIPSVYKYETAYIQYDYERLDPAELCESALKTNKSYVVEKTTKTSRIISANLQYSNGDKNLTLCMNTELTGTLNVDGQSNTQKLTLEGIDIVKTDAGKIAQYMFPVSQGDKSYVYEISSENIPEETISGIILEILKQQPAHNVNGLTAGTDVTFSADAFMPELRGLTLDEAKKAILDIGIDAVNVTERYNEYIPEGHIIDQNYPTDAPVRSDFEYKVVISSGPDPAWHQEVLDLFIKKGWPEELKPHILSSVKSLIKDSGITPDLIFKKLKNNIGRIYIAGESDRIEAFNGLYTGDILLNRYTFNDYILTHEMLHALSKDASSQKMGIIYGKYLSNTDNCSDLNEGYVDYLASKSFPWPEKGIISIGMDGEKPIQVCETVSHAYQVESVLVKALEQMVGEKEFSRMFFGSDKDYTSKVKEFEGRFGNGTWKYLLENASKIIEHKNYDKTPYIKNYYDRLLQCINTEFQNYQDNLEELETIFNKLASIQTSFPLDYNDYRKKIEAIRRSCFSRMQALRNKDDEAFEFASQLPDYTQYYEDDLIRWLKAFADAGNIDVNVSFSDTVTVGKVISVSSASRGKCLPGTIIESDDSFTLQVSYGVRLPEGWLCTPDIIKKMGNTIFEDTFEESSIAKGLKMMELEPVFQCEKAQPGYESKIIKNRIIGQYPEAGTAIRAGSKLTVKVLINP